MAKIGTSCKKCVFYNKEEGSCKTKFLNQFQKQGTDIFWTEDGPVIPRVCPSFRDEKWLEENGSDMELLEKEMHIKGTVIVLVKTLGGLEKTLKNIEIDGIENFSLVVLYRNDLLSSQVLSVCKDSDICKSIDYVCVKTFLEKDEEAIFDSFKRVSNGFAFFIDSEKNFDPKMISKINFVINKLLDVVIYVDSGEFHETVIMSIFFKHLKGDILHSLKEKIKSISKMQGSNVIKIHNWKEINDKCFNKV